MRQISDVEVQIKRSVFTIMKSVRRSDGNGGRTTFSGCM
jgi:hypothetical protein